MLVLPKAEPLKPKGTDDSLSKWVVLLLLCPAHLMEGLGNGLTHLADEYTPLAKLWFGSQLPVNVSSEQT